MVSLSERFRKFDLLQEREENVDSTSPELVSLCTWLAKSLSKKISAIPIWFDYSRDEQRELILNFINTRLNEEFSEIKLTTPERERISKAFLNSVYGFGTLDFLIAQSKVSTVFVNSAEDILYEINGEILKSDIIMNKKQYESLIKRLCEMSGKDSPVVKFRYDSVLVTILKEPVCQKKLILKKVENTIFDFSYFEVRQVLNSDIAKFLRSALLAKKKILISSPVQSGKTAFLNSFLNEVPENKRILLFEEGALINTDKTTVNRFDTEGLTEKEQQDLITAALYYKPDYVFSDINDVGFNIEISDLLSNTSGFVTSIRAESPVEALNLYTAVEAAKLKCTEKQGKLRFPKNFNYIIQLKKTDEYFVIQAIYEVGSNKAGTPVLTEKLSFKSGEYNYNLPNIEPPKQVAPPKEPVKEKKINSFSSRFLR